MPGEIPHFGLYHGEPILPLSEQRESISTEELQKKYPLRYKLYCQEAKDTEPVDSVSPEIIVRRLQMLNNLDRYITTHGRPGRGRVLREKQLAVFRDTREFLETGETEGYVEAPTGFGKTVLFSEVIRATNQRTLVVVPSRILVEQTYNRLRQFNPTLDIGRYYSDKKERDKQVTVTTYQSLIISCGGVRPEDIDLLILDEVHQSLTDVRIQAVGRFASPVKLGFTATPEYTQDKRVENLLNNEIHTVTLKEAVETGLLCSFSVYLAQTDADLSSVKIDEDGDYNERELEEAVNIYSRNKSAVELYKKLNSERPGLSKAITYCVSIKHAKDVARIFNEAGIPAKAVWSDQDPHERRKILEAYNRGDIKILTNVNVLTEGFDDPQAALCLNLRPTLSKVVAKQRGGRVLRLDPDNPHKHAIVVDYLDRNENKRTLQVTFAQVAEGAQIINPVTVRGNGGNGGNRGGSGGVLVDDEDHFDLDNLHVITNSQEVLRIVREIEVLQNEPGLGRVQDTDFVLSFSGVYPIFKGKNSSLLRDMNRVINELRKKYPEFFASRTSGPRVVEVFLNRELFIKSAIENGMRLKDDRGTGDVVNNFRSVFPSLTEVFVGNKDRLRIIANEVMSEIKGEYPKSLAREEFGAVFIKRMEEKGLERRDLEGRLEKVGANDFVISKPYLEKIFVGDDNLLSRAHVAQEELARSYPDIFIRKLANTYRVFICKDVELFIETMVRKGARLRSSGQ